MCLGYIIDLMLTRECNQSHSISGSDQTRCESIPTITYDREPVSSVQLMCLMHYLAPLLTRPMELDTWIDYENKTNEGVAISIEIKTHSA